MACCGGGLTPEEIAAKQASDQTDLEVEKEKAAQSQIIKLLLLGTGESGKSTIFKQAITFYGKGFPDEVRRLSKPAIISNVTTSMLALLNNAPKLDCVIDAANGILAERVCAELESGEAVSTWPRIVPALLELWNDRGIQQTYARRAEFQLPASIEYFLARIDRLIASDYVPTFEDMLHLRTRTAGITETQFLINRQTFAIFDVGGQRTERRKWVHCFENVTAVLFVTAISEYDQKLFEDDRFNRMSESLILFEDISNSKYFANATVILFLNKVDLFKKKIETVPLQRLFPEYTGGFSFKNGAQFVHDKFMSLSKKQSTIAHFTCATDTSVVKRVLKDTTEFLTNNSLQKSGLL